MKKIKSDKIFNGIVILVLLAFAVFTFLPFWMVLINSFATEASISKYGFQLIPKAFTLDGYQYLLKTPQIYRSYMVTILITVIGTALSVFVSMTYAFFLASKKVKYGNTFSFITYLTVLLGTSLVGSYLLIANWLGLKDSIWSMILPLVMNPFFVFIVVSSYKEIPGEINEAAYIDGANDLQLFFRIIIPIVKPTTAIITLFSALRYWNDWWYALMFIDDYKLHPLQMMIRQMISNMNTAAYMGGGNLGVAVPANSLKMVIVCATIGPIILVYPFIQKYFVKGITIGSVKG